MDIIDHVNFKIVNSICYIGLAIQSMNLMVHKCEDPTKRNITIYRRNCVHDDEQYYIRALQFIVSVAPSANARMIIDEYN